MIANIIFWLLISISYIMLIGIIIFLIAGLIWGKKIAEWFEKHGWSYY